MKFLIVGLSLMILSGCSEGLKLSEYNKALQICKSNGMVGVKEYNWDMQVSNVYCKDGKVIWTLEQLESPDA